MMLFAQDTRVHQIWRAFDPAGLSLIIAYEAKSLAASLLRGAPPIVHSVLRR